MINSTRLQQHIETLGQIGENTVTKGMNRFSFTTEEQQANDVIARFMQEAGMTVTVDAVGNVIGTYGSGEETIMMGSHIDTVPEGGKYDGALGVLSAIEVVHTMAEQQVTPPYKIEVVAFKDEEGTRFGFGLLGSRAMAGLLEEQELQAPDDDGITIAQAMVDAGFVTDTLASAVRKDIKAYVELHIEQGKVLENADLPVGVVTGIAAPLWLDVKVIGVSEHAGATPMDLRCDALTASSEMILAIEKLAQKFGIVATVGKLQVKPNGVNVIPGQVDFTIDMRDIDEENVAQAEQQLYAVLQKIAEKRGVQCDTQLLQRVKPAKCDELLIQQVSAAIEAQHLKVHTLPSGAGHDAMNMANVAPIVMIFVRSKGGISHNPLEYSSPEDIAIATQVLYDTIQKIAQ